MMNAKAHSLVADVNVVQAVRSLARVASSTPDQSLGLDEFDERRGGPERLSPKLLRTSPRTCGISWRPAPDVAVQEAVVQSASSVLALAKSSESRACCIRTRRSTTPAFARAASTSSRTAYYLWSAGATLSWPIFAGGPTSAYYNVKSAKNSLLNQETALRTVREATIANLENAWANYANAVDQALGEQAILESYRQRNDEGEVRYASGLLTFDNWQILVTQWVSAEQTSISNWQSAVTAQAAWEQALGKALGE